MCFGSVKIQNYNFPRRFQRLNIAINMQTAAKTVLSFISDIPTQSIFFRSRNTVKILFIAGVNDDNNTFGDKWLESDVLNGMRNFIG